MAKWRILVVEDERDGRQVMLDTMEVLDIGCDAAPTAEVALKLLEENTYDAAIIDLALPGMDGLSLVERIRQHPRLKSLPCVAFTAYHSSKVRQEVLNAGFDAYVAKPIRQTDVVNLLRQIIRPSGEA